MEFHPQPPCVGGYEAAKPIINIKNNPAKEALYNNCRSMVYTQHFLKGKFIEESIGDEYLQWNDQTPVLLDAPTGSGKSTFVCQKLIRDAAVKNANLLLVSNRTALVRQQKMKVAKVVSEYDPYVNSNPKDSVIDEFEIWGNVCICTYHGLPSLLEKAKYNFYYGEFLSNLMYAVFDEAHFLYADATFADPCSELLEHIPAYFFQTIRVYMTATSWSILESLKKSEKNVWYTLEDDFCLRIGINTRGLCKSRSPKREFLHYCMERHYDRYNLYFFSSNGPYTRMAETISDEEKHENVKNAKRKDKISKELAVLMELFPKPSPINKLLVFVRKREDGRELEKAWNKKGIKAVFIDRSSKIAPEQEYNPPEKEKAKKAKAEQKYKNQVWNSLLRDEKFSESVLIATSVLDCGINIHDEAVKTIVCFADDPTSFIQMLGRKRMSAKSAETVDVWVYVPSASRFTQIAETKELELDLAERLDYIRSFQHTQVNTIKGERVLCISNKDGHVETDAPDNILEVHFSQHKELLSRRYAFKYEDTNFYELYYKLWSSYSRISDKQLFFFDSFGQPYVNRYVKWIVEEQKRYYRELENVQDYRTVVAAWLGKDKEQEANRVAQKQKLISLLEKLCKQPVPPERRDDLRSLIIETSLVCLSDNSLTEDWHTMMPKTLNQKLDALGLHYNIERAPGTRSKDWIVTKI